MAIERTKSTFAIQRQRIVSPSIRAPQFGDLGASALAEIGGTLTNIGVQEMKQNADQYIQDHQYDGLNAEVDETTGGVKRVTVPEGVGSYARERLDPQYQKQAVTVAKIHADRWMQQQSTRYALEPEKMREVYNSYNKALVENSDPDLQGPLAVELDSMTNRYVKSAANRRLSRQLQTQAQETRRALSEAGERFALQVASDETAAGESLADLETVHQRAVAQGLALPGTFERTVQSYRGYGRVLGNAGRAAEANSWADDEWGSAIDALGGVDTGPNPLGLSAQELQQMIPDPRMRSALQTRFRSLRQNEARENSVRAEARSTNDMILAIQDPSFDPATTTPKKHMQGFTGMLVEENIAPFSADGVRIGYLRTNGNIPMKFYKDNFGSMWNMTAEQIANEIFPVFNQATAIQHPSGQPINLTRVKDFIGNEERSFLQQVKDSAPDNRNLIPAIQTMLDVRRDARNTASADLIKATSQQLDRHGKKLDDFRLDLATKLGTTSFGNLTAEQRNSATQTMWDNLKYGADYDRALDRTVDTFNLTYVEDPYTLSGYSTRDKAIPKIRPIRPGKHAATADWVNRDIPKFLGDVDWDNPLLVQRVGKIDPNDPTLKFGEGGRLFFVPINTDSQNQAYQIWIREAPATETAVAMREIWENPLGPAMPSIAKLGAGFIQDMMGRDFASGRAMPLALKNGALKQVFLDRAHQKWAHHSQVQNELIEGRDNVNSTQYVIGAEETPPEGIEWNDLNTNADTTADDYNNPTPADHSPRAPNVSRETQLNSVDLNAANFATFESKVLKSLDKPNPRTDKYHPDTPSGLANNNPLGLPLTASATEFGAINNEIRGGRSMASFQNIDQGLLYGSYWMRRKIADGANTVHALVSEWKGGDTAKASVAQYAIALARLIRRDPNAEFESLSDKNMTTLIQGMILIQNRFSTVGGSQILRDVKATKGRE